MLEVFVKYLCFVMMAITGCIVIDKIIDTKERVINTKNIILMAVLLLFPSILYSPEYNLLTTITVSFMNIIIYRIIFRKNIVESIILTFFVMILSFVADIINTIAISTMINLEQMRSVWYIMLIANFTACMLMVIIIYIPIIKKIVIKAYNVLNKNKIINSLLFSILIIIVLCIIDKSLYVKFIFNKNIINELLIVAIFITLFTIYIKEKNSYSKLSKEYDTMFSYISNFEEWIEKEQFNRHEYKNQLAVLRCLSSEKKVKDKIDEMLEDNINLEGKVIHELKMLPKGGIKGLMYYKSAIAQKNKIDLTINVSIELRSLLSKLTNDQIRTLCKLIGIYYDNAIEAAAETKKKVMLVEVYELKDKISFLFSNTFKKHSNFDDRNKKGVSSKGEGHGNGLYFASKLLEKNPWLESKQEIIDKYYIQQLIVHKKEKTSK